MRVLIIQHDPAESLGLLQETFINGGWELDIRLMDSQGSTLPEDLKSYEAMIILGGPMGAYEVEKYPYLLKVEKLILQARDKHTPTLGICLGAQIIARALGGYVRPNPIKEIGWYRVQLTPAGRLSLPFSNLPKELEVFQWHGDTFSLPEGAVLLAEGKTCHNQAFVFANHIWAIQFHPEVALEMIEHWCEVYGDELKELGGNSKINELRSKTLYYWEKMREVREQILSDIETCLHPNSP